MRLSSGIFGLLFALLALGLSWWFDPEAVGALLRGKIAFSAGAADRPNPIVVPVALVLLLPFALRFGLPLALKAALLLPYAAAALSRGAARRATFDPARDLPADSIAPGSEEDIAVNRAIAAALAAHGMSGEVEAVGPSGPVRAPAPAPVGERNSVA